MFLTKNQAKNEILIVIKKYKIKLHHSDFETQESSLENFRNQFKGFQKGLDICSKLALEEFKKQSGVQKDKPNSDHDVVINIIPYVLKNYNISLGKDILFDGQWEQTA